MRQLAGIRHAAGRPRLQWRRVMVGAGRVICANLSAQSAGTLRCREPGLVDAVPADVVREVTAKLPQQ